MATRRYAVIGEFDSSRDHDEYRELSSHRDFENYVYRQLQQHEPLRLVAIEQQDELSRRRTPATRQKFTFEITNIDKYDRFHVSVVDEERHWIQIESTDTGITFAIFD